MSFYNHIKSIESQIDKIQLTAKKMEQYYKENDIDKQVQVTESCLSKINDLHLSQRRLLCSMYDALPSIQRNIDQIEYNALHISVEQLIRFVFPVYKITLPYLLPNKRQKKTILKSAIAEIVNQAVKQYCETNSITPFSRAHVIFVSSYDGEALNVDNDNKEIAIIINGLIGKFIRDDRASSCNTTYYYQKSKTESKTEIYICDKDNYIEVYQFIDR